eukprot:jgi/Tetstr1/420344/TSEL_011464.t1
MASRVPTASTGWFRSAGGGPVPMMTPITSTPTLSRAVGQRRRRPYGGAGVPGAPLRRVLPVSMSSSALGEGGRAGGRKRAGGGGKRRQGGGGGGGSGSGGRFRVSEVKVPWREDAGKDSYKVTTRLLEAIAKRMGLAKPDALPLSAVEVVRKSFDARKVDAKAWVYVVDVDAKHAEAANDGRRPRTAPGRCEWLGAGYDSAAAQEDGPPPAREAAGKRSSKPVVVVGSGPAGLFSALALAEAGHKVLLLERGKAVEDRGRDIGALFVRGRLNAESNLCYGEGGAGTWSDGKLTTRIGRNSGKSPHPVRQVLAALHRFGAPDSVLKAGKPHLGTDRLVRILQGCRQHLLGLGVEIRFSTRVAEVVLEEGRVAGVQLADKEGPGAFVATDNVVLAVGHSARPLYEQLNRDGVHLEAKPFAMGFRIEHPQAVIDNIQYGAKDASLVQRGDGPLPVADYKLTATVAAPPAALEALDPAFRAWDTFGEAWAAPRMMPPASPQPKRGVYSFCMCPGGQVVPTSTDAAFLCVNGMSFSRRNSKWANSALVVGVLPEDWAPWEPEFGSLAGVHLQETIEQRAAVMGGGNLVAPVQRARDFLTGELSSEPLPSSSYRLGVKSAPCHLLFPPPITAALREALNRFEARMPGFLHEEALLHGVETRTSAPVCIRRTEAMCSVNTEGLWPAGEGAGYAGGIVSAAVDGMRVGQALAAFLSGAAAQPSPASLQKFKPMGNYY